MIFRSHKYKAQKTEIEGIVFDSRGEANLYLEIKALMRIGEIISVQPHVRFVLRGLNGAVVGSHTVDFIVVYSDGHKEAWEYKGYIVRDFPIRRKLFEDNYPNTKYVVRTNKRKRWQIKRKA
jgi:hypothetical protein